jgi:hypothetical protein
MQALEDIAAEEAKILSRLRECVARIQELIEPGFADVSSAVALLRLLRSGSAEDINQLQHAALALAAVRHIQAQRPDTTTLSWFWHPFQTGGIDEPDLRATDGARVVISAEVTASERPAGVIDSRMAHTLQKLATMPGDLFYFVRTDAMRRRAQTKIQNVGYAITAATIHYPVLDRNGAEKKRRPTAKGISKQAMRPTHVYEIRPRKDKRGVDLISDALPFGRLWYLDATGAIGYAKFFSRSHDAVIHVYDDAGNVIEMHEYAGEFREW